MTKLSVECADLMEALPCPFCGSGDVTVSWWSDDMGDYDAIECNHCRGAAPAAVWNLRNIEKTKKALEVLCDA